jgi:predicted nucleotidyltransferase
MQFKIEDIVFPDAPFDLLEHSILIGNRGSVAHGTWVENTNPDSIDDIDLMNVVIPPKKYYFGLQTWEMCEDINDPWDVVAYEFKKFLGLLVKQNPNVLMMLWLDPEDYYKIDPLGQALIERRDFFSSREAAKTFIGYAQGQLNRMTHVAGRGYLGAKRKQLVEKHGYDTKNAGHLIRLLHMGKEFLETGKLNVKRTWDRDLLIDIKLGKYSLQNVHQIAADGFDQIRKLEKSSILPKRLEIKTIDLICTQILESWFERRAK